MEKKNMVLLTVIAVATLLVAVVGATFAYFTANVTNNYNQTGNNGQTNVTASKVASKTIVGTVSDEAGEFTATDVYPGHKEIAALQVQVTGEAGDEALIAIKYAVTANTLYDDATITVYGLDTPLQIGETTENNNWFKCEKKSKIKSDDEAKIGQEQTILYYEECADKTNELPANKKITEAKGQETTTIPESGELIFKDVISLSGESTTKYYYVVVEFENNDSETEDQNSLMSKNLQGKITVEAA